MSVLLHAALLGYAMLSIASTPPREAKEPATPIMADVISASELNRMRKGVREAKLDEAQAKDVKTPDEAQKDTPKPRPATAQPPPAAEPPPPPEPEKPAEAAKAEPPPPPAPKAEPPKPEPDKVALAEKLEELALQKAQEETAKQEAEAKAKAEADAKAKADADAKAAEEKRKADEKKKADEKRKRDLAEKKKRELAEKKKRDEAKRKAELAKQKQLDTNRLSALLDKTPDPKQAPAANDAPEKPTNAKGPVRGDAQGRDNTISANEASFLAGLMRQAVSRCWNINAGLDGIQQMVVKVEIRLTPEGRLASPPRVVNNQPSPVFRDAADSAVRALVQCEPYILPEDKYAGGWEHMILSFDPARMF